MHAFLLIGKGDQEIPSMLKQWSVKSWDVVEIGGTGIDDVRSFRRELAITPRGKVKAGIIRNLEALTPQAQNALLKTLEEPPPNTYIIGTTTEPEMILPTIRSRMQEVILTEQKEKTNSELAKKLIAILDLTPGKRLQALDSYAQTRDQAKTFIEDSLLSIEEELRKHPTARLTALSRNLLTARKQLSVNVNHRAVIDNIFLTII